MGSITNTKVTAEEADLPNGIIWRREKHIKGMAKALSPLMMIGTIPIVLLGGVLLLTCVLAPFGAFLILLGIVGEDMVKEGVRYGIKCSECGERAEEVFRRFDQDSAVHKCFKCKTRLVITDRDGVRPIAQQ